MTTKDDTTPVEVAVEPTKPEEPKAVYVDDHQRDVVVTVQLHEKDLESLVQLLIVTGVLYDKVADNAVKADDKSAQVLFAARSKLCQAYVGRLNTYLDFAEPKSKEVH